MRRLFIQARSAKYCRLLLTSADTTPTHRRGSCRRWRRVLVRAAVHAHHLQPLSRNHQRWPSPGYIVHTSPSPTFLYSLNFLRLKNTKWKCDVTVCHRWDARAREWGHTLDICVMDFTNNRVFVKRHWWFYFECDEWSRIYYLRR